MTVVAFAASGIPGSLSTLSVFDRLPRRFKVTSALTWPAFSIGVMHHDVNTKAVFDAVAKMVKPGGKLSVWLYRRNQWWQEIINNTLRRRTVRMPAERLERWCRAGAGFRPRGARCRGRARWSPRRARSTPAGVPARARSRGAGAGRR